MALLDVYKRQGLLDPLAGVGAEQLTVKELLARLKDDTVKEVIMAMNPTVEGEATAMYLAKLIKPLGIRVTRLASGLPVGASLEYADETTLYRAPVSYTHLDVYKRQHRVQARHSAFKVSIFMENISFKISMIFYSQIKWRFLP